MEWVFRHDTHTTAHLFRPDGQPLTLCGKHVSPWLILLKEEPDESVQCQACLRCRAAQEWAPTAPED